jgi:hypothetical protein
VLFSHGPNKHFWYLINVEQQKETVTVQMLTSQMTDTIENDACFSYFQTICSYFGLFDIVG